MVFLIQIKIQKRRLDNKNVTKRIFHEEEIHFWCRPTYDFINVYTRCYRISARLPAEDLRRLTGLGDHCTDKQMPAAGAGVL